jgi:putative salt-induced outer membrane protein
MRFLPLFLLLLSNFSFAAIDTGSPMPSHSLLGGDILLQGDPLKPKFENESSAGIVVASGNSQSQSFTFKQQNKYFFDQNALVFYADFLRASAFGVLNAFRWNVTLRYERSVAEQMSLIFSQGVTSDRFAGYLQRYNTDIGPRYIILREDKIWDWVGEITARYSREHDLGDIHRERRQVRFFTEIKHQWVPGISSGFYLEWANSIHRFNDWEMKSELSSSAALTSVFSVKLAYLLQYDNIPAVETAQKRDAQFTTSLVAKF